MNFALIICQHPRSCENRGRNQGPNVLCQTESTRPVAVTPTVVQPSHTEKKYISRLSIYRKSESLYVFLSIFSDSMRAAEIVLIRWVSRLKDMLTGEVLRKFQDLSEDDKAP